MSVPKDAAADQHSYHCPDCRQAMRRIEGRKGPFWGCTGFPECRTILNDRDGKPSSEIDEHYRCPICTRQLVRADAGKGDYWFCSGYSKGCKVTLKDAGGVPEIAYRCPACRELLVRRKGKYGLFWGCSAYPNCKTTLKDLEGKPDFDLFTAERS